MIGLWLVLRDGMNRVGELALKSAELYDHTVYLCADCSALLRLPVGFCI